MKILSNKEYDRLIIEIESLKEIRKNDDWCIKMMYDKIEKLEEENKKLKEDLVNLQAKYDFILRLYNKYGAVK